MPSPRLEVLSWLHCPTLDKPLSIEVILDLLLDGTLHAVLHHDEANVVPVALDLPVRVADPVEPLCNLGALEPAQALRLRPECVRLVDGRPLGPGARRRHAALVKEQPHLVHILLEALLALLDLR